MRKKKVNSSSTLDQLKPHSCPVKVFMMVLGNDDAAGFMQATRNEPTRRTCELIRPKIQIKKPADRGPSCSTDVDLPTKNASTIPIAGRKDM